MYFDRRHPRAGDSRVVEFIPDIVAFYTRETGGAMSQISVPLSE
jgi:hypothetical protein